MNSSHFSLRAALLVLAIGLCARPAAAGIIPITEVFEPPAPANPAQYGKIAVLQWNPTSPTPVGVTVADAERAKQANRSQIEAFVRAAAAKGAKMVITPEFAVVGYPYHPNLPPEQDNFLSREEVAPYVETVPGPSTAFFSKLSAELGIYLHVGIVEVDAKTQVYYNTVVALGPKGEVLGSYRKIHLYGVESRFLSPGNTPFVYASPFGKVGIVICSDIYSSHPMDTYKNEKLGLLALSTSWAQYNTGMSTFQSGARWVNAFVAAANQMYFPDSGVIQPDGATQSHIRQSRGLAYGYLPYVTFNKGK